VAPAELKRARVDSIASIKFNFRMMDCLKVINLSDV